MKLPASITPFLRPRESLLYGIRWPSSALNEDPSPRRGTEEVLWVVIVPKRRVTMSSWSSPLRKIFGWTTPSTSEGSADRATASDACSRLAEDVVDLDGEVNIQLQTCAPDVCCSSKDKHSYDKIAVFLEGFKNSSTSRVTSYWLHSTPGVTVWRLSSPLQENSTDAIEGMSHPRAGN